ncbi:MAG: HAD family hydrolase, partial [Bradymonadaceae bacterium]
MNKILLFDIDGTLVSTGGAGRRAIERALVDHLGIAQISMKFSFAGMTDRAILRLATEGHGRMCGDGDVDELIERYVAYLPEEVERADYRVFPGVVELLDKLVDLEASAIGLGTGNAERGARIKLERGGLNDYFAFGGYGCTFEDRAELL